MTLPDRPVDGAEIATEWGQEIHDRVFAPAGCIVTTATTRACGTTPLKLHLDVVTQDPGGYLAAASDQIVIPTAREGLYQILVNGDAVNGDVGTQSRFWIYVNGVGVASALEDNNGGTHVRVVVPYLGVFSAGDIIAVYGQRRGTGTNPDMKPTLMMYRVGAELGA